ncbi:NnrU family protein [Pseudoruegeria sp. SK021]|uniref:NnrU family protein n=1 Tax=Pseudoruegeria sp. SK021 TaxID=1933035 RepID=UPI000A237AAA|nr:NnrU family protein [Pseudoruegeria sp. SK021]OSP56101.1 hypothetical protein BV911_03960 [Pseudoruegeria sp. SK021]
MFLLVVGIALWWVGHFLKRAAPGMRSSVGGRPGVSAIIGLGLVLVIIGFAMSPMIPVWFPGSVLIHINNLLMLIAFYVFGIGMAKGRHAQKIRHPMLTGVAIWAVAHLLANGDLASMLLFGSMLVWSVVEMIVINRAEPVWTKPTVVRPNGDLKGFAIAAVLFTVVAGIHVLAGLAPFG